MANTPKGLTFSRKFFDLGNALSQGVSLAVTGAQGGSLAVTFDALDRVGKGLVDQGYKRHAAQVLDQAKKNGASEADLAATEKRMVQLRQDETLAAQKFNAGARATKSPPVTPPIRRSSEPTGATRARPWSTSCRPNGNPGRRRCWISTAQNCTQPFRSTQPSSRTRPITPTI